MSETDMELLERYARQHAEDAFAEIVRRHVALVYSAALRQVRSPQLAEEVAQSVFIDLARQAHQFKPNSILTAWLYKVTHRSAVDVVRREARRQARENYDFNAMNASSEPRPFLEPDDWSHIAPKLDEAMQTLNESDRAAVLLRYFENKSLQEVGLALGTSEEAARKRVTRAVEKLRVVLNRRGVAVGASGLALILSTHAIQAAPPALATMITPAAVLCGAGTAVTAPATLTQTIVMTTLQKAAITTIVVAAVGAGIYEARQVSRLHAENQILRQQPNEQIQRLEGERDEARRELAAVQQELAQVKASGPSEVLRLRGQVGTLQRQLQENEAQSNAPAGGMAEMMADPSMREFLQQAMMDKFRSIYLALFQELNLTPEQRDRFLQLQTEHGSKALNRLSAMARKKPSQVEPDTSGELDQQLQTLLGAEGFARYRDFSAEIPARTMVSLLEAQRGGTALSREQATRLIQIVKNEPGELTQGIVGAPDAAFLGSEADINAFLQRVTESNQRILQQAGAVLDADELANLNTILTNSISSRKVQAAAWIKKP